MSPTSLARRDLEPAPPSGEPYGTEESDVEVEKFLELVGGLTGTPVKPLKDNERNALARALRDDGRQLDCSQLNELLLLVNKDRLEPPFFKYFFPEKLSLALIPQGVERFQRVAMLRYGSFVHAYRTLSPFCTRAELEEELGSICRKPNELIASFKGRSPKILEIDPIRRELTFLIGYLSATQITDENNYADLLFAASAGVAGTDKASWEQVKQRVVDGSQGHHQSQIVSTIEKYQGLNTGHGVAEFAKTLEKEIIPQLRQRLNELKDAQQRATQNQDVYLTWDHMDVYFATSMRKRWEFEDLYDFVSRLMAEPELAELNLRYFDPTQSFTRSRVDKGLVEALMLRRAKCTVYSVQDTDTLGKDSELAATLAQGKPVIAYVPAIDVNERARQLAQQDPVTIQDRLRFLASADCAFASSLIVEDLAFVRDFKAIEQFEQQQIWSSVQDSRRIDELRQKHKAGIDRLCKILAVSEKRLYDGRASTLKDYHPLGLQVHLETGVAHGVLVVRSVPQCAELLRGVLTNDLKLTVEDHRRDKIWYLIERISGCAYRVVTQDTKLTNCFWNFYERG